jgi:hypothetical protein
VGNLIIAIKSCAAHRYREELQRSTWAISHTVWFTGPSLGVPDDYESLPAKVRAMCRDLHKLTEWAFFADTDTYIALDRILAYKPLHPYIGQKLSQGYASGGAGYFLSRWAMELVSKAELPKNHHFEDMWVGEVLAGHNIECVNEPRIQTYIRCLPDNEVFSQHLTGNDPYELRMMTMAHWRYMNGR